MTEWMMHQMENLKSDLQIYFDLWRETKKDNHILREKIERYEPILEDARLNLIYADRALNEKCFKSVTDMQIISSVCQTIKNIQKALEQK